MEIKGVVKDSTNIIAFANVYLTDQNDKIVTGTTSDESGAFNLSVKQGNYKLTISFMGYLDWSEGIDVTTNQDLGIIVLAQDNSQLDEVVVTAKKPLIERKVDRLVFNVENSISAIGGNGLDALRVTPGILVQNGAVSMIGKDGMAIMVNDRLIQLSGNDLINFLKTLRTDDIKSIEVITNPPAKYDAEGNSGLINIKLRHSKRDSWNVSLSSMYRQATYPMESWGGNFSYQKGKLSFFSNFNYENGSKKEVETEKIIYPTQTWNNDFKNRKFTNISSGRLGLDYQLSNKWSAGIQYLGSFNKPHSRQNNNSEIKNTSIDSLLNTMASDNKKISSNSYNIHSVVKLDTLGKKISTDFDYLNYGNDNSRNFQTQTTNSDFNPTPNGFQSVENNGVHNLEIYLVKIDVDYPTSWVNLNFGSKIYFTKTHYNNQYFDTTTGNTILQSDRSNVFNYDENTQAFYFMGNKKMSEKWSFQFGLRAENTQTKGHSITLGQIDRNSYFQLFPTVYILNRINDDNVFSLNYGRRLSRPRYNELNPFQVYYSPYSYTQGNPALSPSFTDNIELQYAFKNVLYSTLSYSYKTQGRGNPPFFDEDNKTMFLLDINFYNTNTYNLSETYVFNKLDWWEAELQGSLYYTTVHFTKDVNFDKPEGWGAFLSANNRFALNADKTINGEVNFWYQSPQFQDIYNIKGMASLDLGLKFSLLKNKLNIGVMAEDILKTNVEKAKTKSSSTNYSYSYYNDYRSFKVSLNYQFGASKLHVKKRSFGNEEEKSRIDN